MSTIQQLLTEHLDIWTSADTAKKTGRGRSSSNADKVYGIKKLRELILELAVRGKLVPQDPNDEPASELLKRIQKEKTRLLAEGKIKKEKPLTPIREEEKPFELPKKWEWARLGNIISYVNGFAFSSKDFSTSGVGIVKIGDIQDGCLVSEGMSRISSHIVTKLDDQLKVKPGDLVIAMSGATTGKLGFNNTNDVFYLNQRVGKIVPFIVSKRFLYFDLTSKIAANLEKSFGSAIPNLSTEQINTIVIALPSVEEQRRIVSKVDELMAFCDQLETQHNNAIEAHEKLISHLLSTLTQSTSPEEFNENWQRIAVHFDVLFTTESSVDVLKQTLLQLAVMGKLVPQDPNDEPASELLKRIQTEKTKLIAEGKIKKEKPLASISDDEKPFELPMGWEWCRFRDITKLITDGKHGDCNDTPSSGYYFLSAKDIQNGQLLYEKARQIAPDEFQEVHRRTDLEPGDICMVNTGATVGKIAIASDHPFTFKTTFQKSVAVIKVLQPYIHQPYITNFLIAEASNLLKKSGGSAINNLLLGDLKMKTVPLPPENEQVIITIKVSELMALCDQLKKRIVDASQLQKTIAEVMFERGMI